MNSHKNARLTAKGRALLVRRVRSEGWTVGQASDAAGISRRTGYKWLARYRFGGSLGLEDRSSRPLVSPHRIEAELVGGWERRRRERWTLRRMADESGRSMATVSRYMRAAGLSRLSSLEPPRPVVRYERSEPGDLVHIDIKKQGKIDGIGHRIHGDRRTRKRGIGWDAVHMAIDDYSRVSFAMVLADETAASCVHFPEGRSGVLPESRRPSRERHDRQRNGLQEHLSISVL
jgi:transposase